MDYFLWQKNGENILDYQNTINPDENDDHDIELIEKRMRNA